MNKQPIFQVTDAIEVINQTLDYAYPSIIVVGEVSSFRVNQNKWIFFDIKDDESKIECFMSKFNLRIPIENGMKVMVVAKPNLTKWGKFSLTIQQIKPVGEGNLKKAFEILKKKLEVEGLFAPERKRRLPELPEHIGVISSTGAAGYQDFMKIIGERFGGLKIDVINTMVQGLDAPDQIISALNKFNEQENLPEVIVLIRGGGSRDDLVAFDDELLVRTIAASRIPVLVGVGHEIDVTLADLVADVRAATPSNAAEILVPDRREIIAEITAKSRGNLDKFKNRINQKCQELTEINERIKMRILHEIDKIENLMKSNQQLLDSYNPQRILERGYAIIRGKPEIGEKLEVETDRNIIETEVKNVRKK